MSVGGEVQLCTSKAWVFQPILPNLTFAFVTAFTSCTPSHNLRPFRSVSTNRRRDAVSGSTRCGGARRPPSPSGAKPVTHPTTINLTASLVVSVTLPASSGFHSKSLHRALTRNSHATPFAGLLQCALRSLAGRLPDFAGRSAGEPAASEREKANVANLQASIRFPHMHPRRRWTTV